MTRYRCIATVDDVRELMAEVTDAKYVAYDLETTSLNPRQGKVIGVAVCTYTDSGWYLPLYKYDRDADELREVYLDGDDGKAQSAYGAAVALIQALIGKRLIMHNGSFDCRYTQQFFGIDLVPSLWVDTMLLVHTVQETGVGPMGGFALKDIAVSIQSEIGIDVDRQANEEQIRLKESITKNGGSTSKTNYEIWKADLDILAEYAAADTDLTFRVCKYFLRKLEHEGLTDFFFEDEVMPIYREVTIQMEMDGIKLDIDLLHQTDEAIKRDIEHYGSIVLKELTSDPRFRQWLLQQVTKTYPPKTKGKYAQKLLEIYGLDVPLRKKELQALPDDCEIKNFLLTGSMDGVDPQVFLKASLALWKEDHDGQVMNIRSKQQLGQIVFEYFNEKPLSQTAKGAPQFDDDMLDSLAGKYPWARSLQVYNKLVKIKSAYIDRFLEESEDGRFYPYFKQHGTVSGRYGSNLQQLPKPLEPDSHEEVVIKYTNIIRAFFICDPGYVFVDCDYQALEPHIFASVTDDKNLQEIFDKGYDFYSYVAIKTKKLQGVSADKKADNFLKKVNPQERAAAKPYSLGMAYGMSPYALAMSVGVSQKEGEELHKGYLEGFPGVAQWIDRSRALVKEQGFIRNLLGRTRHLPEVKELYQIFGDSLLDWKAREQYIAEFGEPTVTAWKRDYQNGLNSLLNFQIQSMAASVVNRAALQINRYLKQHGIDGKVVAQIHDQLIVQVPEDRGDELAKVVQHLMETTTTLPGVTLKAPPALAHNFLEGHE